jgi:PAS domain S-box-containing protein
MGGGKTAPVPGAVLDLTSPDSADLHHAVSKAVLDRTAFGYANLALQTASCGRFDQALAGKCGSNLAFPIVIDNVVEGGITLYAEVINGFPPERAQRLHLLAHELGRTLGEYRARRKLQGELKRLATVVEQSAEGVMITDSAGIIRYVNPAFERITGYGRSEVIGRNPGVMKSGRNAASIYRELWRTIKSGQVWQGRLINKRKDGRLYHEAVSISPIFDAQGRASGYVAVKRDITEQLSLESRLRQTQKMEALGTLAGGIAHDFNNILYPIIGYAELILGNMETHTPNHRRVEEILSCAKHANELVNQILAFSRRSKPKLRPLRLQPIVREAIKPFRAFLPPSMELRLELDEACGFVMADPTHIRQIVLNLITNAQHAMEETGGSLQVQLRPTELGKEKLPNEEMRPGHYICLSVADEGMGIDKAVMDKLFDPYFTTKAKGKGTGLGLAVVHGIVTGYGGGVRVRNRMDKGARLDIYFPLSRRRAPMEIEPEMDELPMGDEHILVVDDEVHNMNLLEDSLGVLGYRVSKHAGSLAALAAFREAPDRFDLVVTDYAMPQMNGDRLAKEMLALRPQLPIILCTGFSERFSVAEARAIGIRNYLQKPLSRHTLAQTVRRALDSAAG